MFDMKVIAQQQYNSFNILEYSNIEESYFADTLNMVTECMNDYRYANEILYKSMLESGNDAEVINESFSDFFEKVKSIIDKFLKYIKSLFDRFIINLNKFISSDKFIVKHKDKLKQFSDQHNFEIEGYEYTFSPNVPLINAQARFEDSFIKLDFGELQGIKDPKLMLAKVKEKYGILISEINGDYYDNFRGQVIGKGSIAQEDFADELWRVYRSDAAYKQNVEIDNAFIVAAIVRFENYKKLQDEVKKTKENIEKDYENIKKQVQHMIKQNNEKNIKNLISFSVNSEYDKAGVGDVQVSTEVMNIIDVFMKKKVEQILEMSNAHSIAFSYKLDAIKDCYKQDKDVLYKSLSKITKNPSI